MTPISPNIPSSFKQHVANCPTCHSLYLSVSEVAQNKLQEQGPFWVVVKTQEKYLTQLGLDAYCFTGPTTPFQRSLAELQEKFLNTQIELYPAPEQPTCKKILAHWIQTLL